MEKKNMTKIAVVGVDGSGKTVMMAAMGEMYESPDADGYFLSAEDSRTFHNVKALVGRMRGGAWPGATDAQSVTDLNWMLCRQGEESVQRLAEISFSDYAGEIYRLAFGEHPEDEIAPFKDQIDTLKAHIREADTLLVLVNLKDIISGDLTNLRTREMLWLTKDIVDYAFAERRRSNGKREVALVFTQSSTYSEVIGAADGLVGAYRKYLPHVASLYPSLKLFAVSAVDRTVLDADGYEIPAQDFGSYGLSELMGWLVAGAANVSSLQDIQSRRRRRRFMAIAAVAMAVVGAIAGCLVYARNMRISRDFANEMWEECAQLLNEKNGEIMKIEERHRKELEDVRKKAQAEKESSDAALAAEMRVRRQAEERLEDEVRKNSAVSKMAESKSAVKRIETDCAPLLEKYARHPQFASRISVCRDIRKALEATPTTNAIAGAVAWLVLHGEINRLAGELATAERAENEEREKAERAERERRERAERQRADRAKKIGVLREQAFDRKTDAKNANYDAGQMFGGHLRKMDGDFERAEAAFKDGKIDEAFEAFQSVLAEADWLSRNAPLRDAARKRRDEALAAKAEADRSAAERLAAVKYESAKSAMDRAETDFAEARFAEAEEAFKEAAPKFFDAKKFAMSQYWREQTEKAKAQEKAQDWRGAFATGRNMLALSPEDGDARGIVERAQEHFDDGQEMELEMAPGLSMKFVWVKPGMMGNKGIPKGFWIGKTEVTQKQWAHVLSRRYAQTPKSDKEPDVDPSAFTAKKKPWLAWTDTSEFPVESVSRDDCQVFISELNKQHPGCNFKLPTYDQWLYAAKGGSRHSGSEQEAWSCRNSGIRTLENATPEAISANRCRPHAVYENKQTANSIGIIGMKGNVSEMLEYTVSRNGGFLGSTSCYSHFWAGGAWNDYSGFESNTAGRTIMGLVGLDGELDGMLKTKRPDIGLRLMFP